MDVRIEQLVVVEGAHDISAVRQAVEAEVVATNGHALDGGALAVVRRAREGRGVILLLDPDHAGQVIRRKLEALVGPCLHAHVPRAACTRPDGNVGIENASPEAIRAALAAVRVPVADVPRGGFTIRDLLDRGLTGPGSRTRREGVADALSLGHCNARQLLRRLNHLGVSADELDAALMGVLEGDGVG